MSKKRKQDFNETSQVKKLNDSKIELDVINLSPTLKEQLIYLNKEKTSWIKLIKLEANKGGLTQSDFEDLWKLKPSEKLKIKIAGKLIECPRYSKSFLKAYKFTGLNHEADMDLPKRIQELLEWSKKEYKNEDLNQSLVNWYESDGSIGKHSDDTKQLKPDSDIFSFSFGPATRKFILEPKVKTVGSKKYHINVENNTLVIMGGKCQLTHYHSVPKVNNDANRRLNVTFRCFK
jgi:alkylated DNA repair dioxygenase AlkB